MEVIYQKLAKGFHPRSQAIGLEIERIGCCVDQKVIRYSTHIEPLLEALRDQQNWQVTYESEGHLLGLQKNGAAISLEPGAQFELATPPVKSVFDVREVQENLDLEIRKIPFAKNWTWMDLGLNPVDSADDLSLLPSERYRLMDKYFQKIPEGRGREMMRLSAGFQVNVDTPTEREALRLLRVSYFLAPLLTAIFPFSPYYLGRASGHLSERFFVWQKTDPIRCGFLTDVFCSDYSLRDYVEYAAKLPLMYAFDEKGEAFDPEGLSWQELPKNLQETNALFALKQLFLEARLNPGTIEIRCFDQQSPGYRYAAIALISGIVYDEDALKYYEARALKSSPLELKQRMEVGAKSGLKEESIYVEAIELLKKSERGLKKRGFGEASFLCCLCENLEKRITPAEQLLERLGTEFRLG